MCIRELSQFLESQTMLLKLCTQIALNVCRHVPVFTSNINLI